MPDFTPKWKVARWNRAGGTIFLVPHTHSHTNPQTKFRVSSARQKKPGLRFEIAASADSCFRILKQRFGVFQIRRLEAFGEPTVDFGEHLLRFFELALLPLKTREAHYGA